MDAEDLYRRVAARLPDGLDREAETVVHEVLATLAERLRPDEAAELGAELPDELGDVLAGANGDGNLTREQLLEDIASRLDIDDDAAETATMAVLSVVREALEPVVEIDQILESLPSDLAQLMS